MTSNHQQNQPPLFEIRFFKVILDTTLQRRTTMIPNKFTKIYGGNLSNPVFLKAPDGIKWKVYWTKDDGGRIWLNKGWKEFATHYFLRYGHMVMFKYKETRNLDVMIFDGGSTFEINYPCHNSNDTFGVLDEVAPSQNSKPKSTISTPQPHKKMRRCSTGVVGQSSNLPQQVQTKGQSFKTYHVVQFKVSEDRGGATGSLQVQQFTSEAVNKAATSRSYPPSFTVVMQDSYVRGFFMVIPLAFTRKYLKEKQRDDILLQVLGRTWLVKLSLGRFSTGWKKFASENHLKVEDVCLFELTKSQGYCFEVTIIRVSEETHSPVQGDADPIPDLKSDISIEAMRKAAKFTPENPYFKITIKGNHQGDTRPRLPLNFMRKYLHNKHTVELRIGQKSWRVNVIGDVRTKLSSGWAQFEKESKLRIGDVCIFELIDQVDVLFDVHIFRGRP